MTGAVFSQEWQHKQSDYSSVEIITDMLLTFQHGFVVLAISCRHEDAWKATKCTKEGLFHGIPVELLNNLVLIFEGLAAEGEV